ncbi:PhzF family phenazine biosynthesis protein [Nonomuraea sp. SBT364]|uniref:PhzF family phenazine biosynthesis protein n=1 Tax=Nonomuraea sp. SBT364 TaxID=1580530 RepID=UPI00066E76C6|nr:PhzF family phenazine biosynthesis protein [Nonomuraea sp. SBT364]
MQRPFRQVDVFTSTPYRGNPLAVVLDAEGLTTEEMRRFANWTNLSETTFVLPPADPAADYRVRIFTPSAELPFAGHPTLGTCHAWLEAGGVPRDPRVVVQECGAGLIRVRGDDGMLAFAAPPLLRSGPVDESLLSGIAEALGITRDEIADAEWADNGPGWVALLLRDADAVLALRPGRVPVDVGVAGLYPAGSPFAYELRAFFPFYDSMAEDPVTGSLNASVAQWLLRTGRVTAPYTASQGTAMGRAGRIRITAEGDDVWVGGSVVTSVTGQVSL